MRSGLKTGNWFLLMKDEVTYFLYICSAIWPFLWLISKIDTANRNYMKSLQFRVYPLGYNFNSMEEHASDF